MRGSSSSLGRCVAAAAAIAAAGTCGPAMAQQAKTVHREIPVTTAHDYYRYHAARKFSDFVVLDVRPADKRRGAQIKGARALPFVDAAASRKAFAALDGRKAYMLYCGDGKRAQRALQLMRELHFREVYSVRGGLAAWQRKRYPVQPIPPAAARGAKRPAPPAKR